MIAYLVKYYDQMIELLIQHTMLVFYSVAIALVVAIIISALSYKRKGLAVVLSTALNIIYTIPALALFAFLIRITGLGKTTAIIALVIYNQIILLKNIMSGLESIDSSVIESGTGMGLSDFQIFWKIKLPLAMPFIMAGLKLSVVTTVPMATLASEVGGGGLGIMIFDGMRRMFIAKIVWGTILSTILAVLANEIFGRLENLAIIKSQGGDMGFKDFMLRKELSEI